MRRSLVSRRTSQGLFAFAISQQADTFISYQGQRPSSGAVKALDSEPLMASAIFGDNENPNETGWVA
jgi:hypothetical protein